MDEPKTPPLKATARDPISISPRICAEDDETGSCETPQPHRSTRTAPADRDFMLDEEDDPFQTENTPSPQFSKETADESPSITALRRRLRRTHFDTRLMDRPIARPMGPRDPPVSPVRQMRKRHSEPGDTDTIRANSSSGGQTQVERHQGLFSRPSTRLVGPRPLASGARGFGTADAPATSSSSGMAQKQEEDVERSASTWESPDEDDESDSGLSTPKASRFNRQFEQGDDSRADEG